MQTTDRISPEDGRAEVMAADRAFDARVQARGLEGWIEFMAPDAVRLPKIGFTAVQGLDQIRRVDSAVFADPSVRLTWEPSDGGLFADLQTGFTTGRFQVLEKQLDRSERVLSQGGYVSIWRRQPDGNWRVILDTGASDPAPATGP